MEEVDRRVDRNVRRFFEYQAEIDKMYPYIYLIEGLIQEMTSSLEEFKKYYKYIDFYEVEGFYRRLSKKCEYISDLIFKMLLEIKKKRVKEGEW